MRKIVSTKDVLFGMPRIDGRRISVYNIVSSLWNNKNIDEYSEIFEISKNEIFNALVYCKNLECQKNNVIQYCEGCVLNTINSEKAKINYKELDNGVFIDNDNNIFFADNISQIENEDFGFSGWYRAEQLFEEIFNPNDSNYPQCED